MLFYKTIYFLSATILSLFASSLPNSFFKLILCISHGLIWNFFQTVDNNKELKSHWKLLGHSQIYHLKLFIFQRDNIWKQKMLYVCSEFRWFKRVNLLLKANLLPALMLPSLSLVLTTGTNFTNFYFSLCIYKQIDLFFFVRFKMYSLRVCRVVFWFFFKLWGRPVVFIVFEVWYCTIKSFVK